MTGVTRDAVFAKLIPSIDYSFTEKLSISEGQGGIDVSQA